MTPTALCVNGCLSRDRHVDECLCTPECPDHEDHCHGCLPRRATFGHPRVSWCGGCERRVQKALLEIWECWPEMFTAGSSSIAGKGSAPALYTRDDDDQSGDDVPSIDRVTDVRQGVLVALGRLVRWVVAERDLFLKPSGDDVPALVRFLIRHLEWMAGQRRVAAVVYDEIRSTASIVRRTARPERKDWTSLGPCPLTKASEIERPDGTTYTETGPCDGTVRAYTDPEYSGNQIGVCSSCYQQAVPEWWERKMWPDRDTSRLVAADDLVGLVYRGFGKAVKPATVRWWVHQGVIEPYACLLATRANLFDSATVMTALSKKGIA